MFLRVYCQSYDISCSWGSWFDVSCQDDIARVYRSATAHGVEYIFSFDYPDMVFEYLFDSYDIDYIFDMIEDFSYIEINKGGSFASVEVLTGYYFFDMLDVSGIPVDFIRHFDYEAYGRDILFEYTYLEDSDSFYLFES